MNACTTRVVLLRQVVVVIGVAVQQCSTTARPTVVDRQRSRDRADRRRRPRRALPARRAARAHHGVEILHRQRILERRLAYRGQRLCEPAVGDQAVVRQHYVDVSNPSGAAVRQQVREMFIIPPILSGTRTRHSAARSSRRRRARRRSPRVDDLRLAQRRLRRARQQMIDALDALREAVILIRHFVLPRAEAAAAVDAARLERGQQRRRARDRARATASDSRAAAGDARCGGPRAVRRSARC